MVSESTHVGRVSPVELQHFKNNLKTRFDQGEWSFEDNDRIIITNEKIDSNIEVIINGEPTEFEESIALTKYGVVFKSNFFDHWRNRDYHQNLCTEVCQKITWQKQAYFLVNDKWVPVPKKLKFKMKRKRGNVK